MNAPERIWINPSTDLPRLSGHLDKNSIEYIRKDAFINKACEWLLNNFKNYSTNELGSEYLIEDFKNYMKGE